MKTLPEEQKTCENLKRSESHLAVGGVSAHLFGPGGFVVAAGRLVFVVVQLLLVLRRPRWPLLLLLLLQRHQVRPLLLQLPLQPLGLPLLLNLLPLVLLHIRHEEETFTPIGFTATEVLMRQFKKISSEWEESINKYHDNTRSIYLFFA